MNMIRRSLLVFLLLSLLLTACTKPPAPTTLPPETTVPVETTAPPENTQPIEPELGTPAYFEDLLNPALYRSESDWLNRALTSFYDVPAHMDLYQLFYCGIPGLEHTPTAEELAFLEVCPEIDLSFDLDCLPTSEMDRVLTQYFGVTLSETDGTGLKNFVYWEETDCYYHTHSDSNGLTIQVSQCEETEPGIWSVTYTTHRDTTGIVTLCLRDGNWQFLSNLPTP